MRATSTILLALLAACGPKDSDSDAGSTAASASSGDSSSGDSSSGDGATSAAASSGSTGATTAGSEPLHFTPDVWPLLEGCNCHTSPPPGPGPSTNLFLGLDPAGAYDALVDVPSSAPGLDQVEPGDSAKSYLYHKLAGTFADVGGGGTIMPPGGMFDPVDLATIQAWIDEGALE